MAEFDDLFPGMYARFTKVLRSVAHDRDDLMHVQRAACVRNSRFVRYYTRRAFHEGTDAEIEWACSLNGMLATPRDPSWTVLGRWRPPPANANATVSQETWIL